MKKSNVSRFLMVAPTVLAIMLVGCSKKSDVGAGEQAQPVNPVTNPQGTSPTIPATLPPLVNNTYPTQPNQNPIVPQPIGNGPTAIAFCTVLEIHGNVGSGKTYPIAPVNWNGKDPYATELPTKEFGRDTKLVVTLTAGSVRPRILISGTSLIDDHTGQQLSIEGTLSGPIGGTFHNATHGYQVSCSPGSTANVTAAAVSQFKCQGTAKVAGEILPVSQIVKWNGQQISSGTFDSISPEKLDISAQLVPALAGQAPQVRLLIKDSLTEIQREFIAPLEAQEVRLHTNEGQKMALDLNCSIQ